MLGLSCRVVALYIHSEVRVIVATMIPRNKALLAASKKIRVLGVKALESNLEAFCGSYGEAYRRGVEEAQGEIVSRLTAIPAHSVADTEMKP